MMSLPEGGGRRRHDPGRLARQPACQATSSPGAARQRLDEVAAAGKGRWRQAGLGMLAGPWPTPRAVPTSGGSLACSLPE